ncbi:MAG TPA: hypothetical protein VGH74_13175 [Planctomycetaceae bacterium]
MRTVAVQTGSADSRGYSVNNAWTQIAACAVLASLLPVLARLRARVVGTALSSAWPPLAVAWLIWLVVAVVTLPPFAMRAWADSLWFLAAIVALVPPIAVLGARRPTSRVWTWFVLVPLVLVFAWPVVPVMTVGARPAAFNLEAPLVVGYGLVLVMGAGNYLGLAHTISALLWMAGLSLVVLPLCPATNGALPDAWSSRMGGTFCLAAAGWIADRQAAGWLSAGHSRLPFDRAWSDFRELFGIVWAKRIQERFNDDARRRGLKLRLGFQGLEDASGGKFPDSFDSESLATAETSLRWLLQKFVDPEWIDQRLPPKIDV